MKSPHWGTPKEEPTSEHSEAEEKIFVASASAPWTLPVASRLPPASGLLPRLL